MKELVSFDYMGNGVRTIEIDGEPWFVARDVCDILGLDQVHRAISSLDLDEKGRTNVTTLGGNQNMSVVNEPGLYSLIMRSRKPEAKAFKRWVTHEVLPTIRKTGKYVTTRGKSKEVRNTFTAVLKEHGYDKPVEYATTTNHMKEIIGLSGLGKNLMTPDQLKKTMAAELIAELHIKHTGAFGYRQVDPVCIESSRNVVALIEARR